MFSFISEVFYPTRKKIKLSKELYIVCNETVVDEVLNKKNYTFGKNNRDEHNKPEKRRNDILKTLVEHNIGKVKSAPSAKEDMSNAKQAHDPGYINFLQTLWERANKAKKSEQDGWLQEFDIDGEEEKKDIAYGSFVFTKEKKPRISGNWMAELVAYSCDDGPIFDDTAEAMRWDLGVVEKSVETVLTAPSGVQSFVYGMVTHPGHHAGPAYLSGYCLMNNVAIAAKMLQSKGRKVGIVDVDYHGGNGTYDFIESGILKNVKFCSLHVEAGYPYTEMKKNGKNLATTTNWDAYSKQLTDVLDKWENEIDTLIVSLGWDTFYIDPIGGFKNGLYLEDFHKMGQIFGKLNHDILFFQEGGYALEYTPTMSRLFFHAVANPNAPIPAYEKVVVEVQEKVQEATGAPRIDLPGKEEETVMQEIEFVMEDVLDSYNLAKSEETVPPAVPAPPSVSGATPSTQSTPMMLDNYADTPERMNAE